jgi:signal transduction histidine kinase
MSLTLYPRRREPGGERAVNGPELEPSPVLWEELLDPVAWQDGLERYARAMHLAVALVDPEGRLLGPCLNPQPLWELLHAPLTLPSPPVGERGTRQTLSPGGGKSKRKGGGFCLARDRTGLVHFAVPLALGEHVLGALVAGQVFDQYPEQLAVEHAARHFGLSPQEVWQVARLEHPVKQATLRVYADLLATLAHDFLRSTYHTMQEAERLAEMTRLRDQLRQRTQDLSEANRRKDEFLAMLAHELRNPLAPIRNAVQVVRLLAQNDANLRWAGEVVERQVRHMTRLVDDLLDASRFASGKITLQKEPTELAAVVARAVEAARPNIEGRRQELSVTLLPQRLHVEADPIRLAQVVSNLLNNAAKYTPEGGRIWLAVQREGDEAVLSVRDTGIGIPDEMLSRIFDLFTQVDRTLDRAQGGLGIGLTLVKSLVELHGGSVQAFSKGPNTGSEFVVRLPLLPDTQPPQPARGEGNSQAAPSLPRRILVVDDNVDAAESLGKWLEHTGHEVRISHDGDAALEMARTYQPEVVLLDIGLPRMDGYEVARRLREEPATEHALLVALTGWGQAEDRRRSREAGFDHHLTKPADPETL